jgi:D-3-phosphoglycerate dehydrogenase
LYGFWCERPLPAKYAPLLDGVGVLIGAGSVSSPEFMSHAEDVHVIIAGAASRFDAALMQKVPNLKVISRTGIGVDNVSIPDATARGIAVCNAPDVPTRATAEHAITLLLATLKHLHQADRALEKGERRDFYSQHRAIEIEGLQLGLVGLGRIGGKVAQYGRGLGMVVTAYDPYLPAEQFPKLGIKRAESLEALLAQSDVISLHVPATAENIGLMNATRFAQMKAGSYLINTARGSLVDEVALVAALESGHLHGAGLDVFQVEPPPADHPLLHRDDVIATPHIGGVSVSSRERFWEEALTQAVQYLTGERPANLVNPAIL